jgi:hypothetical protein
VCRDRCSPSFPPRPGWPRETECGLTSPGNPETRQAIFTLFPLFVVLRFELRALSLPEPQPSPFSLWSFWRWGLAFCPGPRTTSFSFCNLAVAEVPGVCYRAQFFSVKMGSHFFPGLTSNLGPPDLCLPSCWDYRREPPGAWPVGPSYAGSAFKSLHKIAQADPRSAFRDSSPDRRDLSSGTGPGAFVRDRASPRPQGSGRSAIIQSLSEHTGPVAFELLYSRSVRTQVQSHGSHVRENQSSLTPALPQPLLSPSEVC